MKLTKEIQEKIQELTFSEQNLQNISLQKQAFQLELTETSQALEEIKKSSDAVYKIIGNIMIKAEKKDIEKEFQEKSELLSLRLKSIEKQEKILSEKAEKLKKELEEQIKTTK